jgi:ubiquinone/menaquinone biosynthesis C-methylase UbiE
MANFNSMTQRLLVGAGIASGMCVIDIGRGGGEVSLFLARMVGEDGRVLCIDRDANALDMARKRTYEQVRTNISFLHSDLSEPVHCLVTFDAIVRRRVLMYLPDRSMWSAA